MNCHWIFLPHRKQRRAQTSFRELVFRHYDNNKDIVHVPFHSFRRRKTFLERYHCPCHYILGEPVMQYRLDTILCTYFFMYTCILYSVLTKVHVLRIAEEREYGKMNDRMSFCFCLEKALDNHRTRTICNSQSRLSVNFSFQGQRPKE